MAYSSLCETSRLLHPLAINLRVTSTDCRRLTRNLTKCSHVAMDVLPAQASSVPSERAFSSSKLTCTERRNKLSHAIVEALQILKFSFKQDRLNFTPDLVADDRDYAISSPVTSRAVEELMQAAAYDELGQLLANVQ